MPAARLFPDSNRARGFQVTWGGYLWVIAQVGRYPDAGDLADSVNVYTMIEASVMAKANATATKMTMATSSCRLVSVARANTSEPTMVPGRRPAVPHLTTAQSMS